MAGSRSSSSSPSTRRFVGTDLAFAFATGVDFVVGGRFDKNLGVDLGAAVLGVDVLVTDGLETDCFTTAL